MSDTTNRDGIAKALHVSLPTVDALRHEGMPCVQAGSRGRSYRYDVDICRAWKRARDAAMRGGGSRELNELAQSWCLGLPGPLTTMTGVARRCKISSSVAKPSRPGIWRSSVTTSGWSSSTSRKPSLPSLAVPTTANSDSKASESTINSRTSAESSMAKTRIGGRDMEARLSGG